MNFPYREGSYDAIVLFFVRVILHAKALVVQFDFTMKMLLPRREAQTLLCTAAEMVNT